MDTRKIEQQVEVEVVGREHARTLSVAESVLDGELKLPSGNGYDHFVLDHHEQRGGQDVPVFVFAHRTRIAE